jgi:casein kinase II subunit alpha
MSKLPKYYSQVCKNKPDDYIHYEAFNIKLGNPHRYEIKEQVGRGNYSDVFYGLDTSTNKPVIIKFLKPVKMVKVKREIKIL